MQSLQATSFSVCARRSDAEPFRRAVAAFTMVELLVVVAVISVLAAMLLPAVVRARGRAEAVYCLNNTRQLLIAWQVYADDHDGRLAYNFGGNDTRGVAATQTNLNWVNNIMDWSVRPNSDNTNLASITQSSLGQYAKCTFVYRCPSDHVLSSDQKSAGWKARIRSYSMNAMVGDAGEISSTGVNRNNPDYVQFFQSALIPKPDRIFVFIDEHPDSINDGYFLNKWNTPPTDPRWTDLPASYHNGAANLSFADGHSEKHGWRYAQTRPPALPESLSLPTEVTDDQYADFYWLLSRMSFRNQ